jgi:peptidoglycan-N-acetylglucosamine deacetylase
MRSQIGFGVAILLVVAFAIGLNTTDTADRASRNVAALSASASSHATMRPPSSSHAPSPRPPTTRLTLSQLKPAPLPHWPGSHRGYGPVGSMATTGAASVALTFDDGPGPYTGQILGLLEKYHIKATFCMIGRQIYSYADEVKRMIRDGDTLCNHSWDHDEQMGEKSLEKIQWEMSKTNAAIHKIDPSAQIRYFRNPGGNFTKSTVAVCENMGMRPLFWSVDTRDWSVPGVNHIQAQLAVNTHHGSIVLMHDGGGDRTETLEALRVMLPRLANQYTLIPLPTT